LGVYRHPLKASESYDLISCKEKEHDRGGYIMMGEDEIEKCLDAPETISSGNPETQASPEKPGVDKRKKKHSNGQKDK